MRIKGYTVHYDNGLGHGYGICGTKARGFLTNPGTSTDWAYVTCRKCEQHASLCALAADAKPKGSGQ